MFESLPLAKSSSFHDVWSAARTDTTRFFFDFSECDADEVERNMDLLRRKDPENVYEVLTRDEIAACGSAARVMVCATHTPRLHDEHARLRSLHLGSIGAFYFILGGSVVCVVWYGYRTCPEDLRSNWALITLIFVLEALFFMDVGATIRFAAKRMDVVESVLERAKKRREKDAGMA